MHAELLPRISEKKAKIKKQYKLEWVFENFKSTNSKCVICTKQSVFTRNKFSGTLNRANYQPKKILARAATTTVATGNLLKTVEGLSPMARNFGLNLRRWNKPHFICFALA